MPIDGEPQMGGGSDVGWIAPNQDFRVATLDTHWTLCAQAEAERGTPFFPIFEFSVNPEDQHSLDPDISVSFGTPVFVAATNDESRDRTLVPITVINNTGRSGYLNLTAQILNAQSEVIGYGGGSTLSNEEGSGTSIAVGETLNAFLFTGIGKPSTNGAPADIGFTGASYRVSYLSITSQDLR
jgi:hypothetical protein